MPETDQEISDSMCFFPATHSWVTSDLCHMGGKNWNCSSSGTRAALEDASA